MNRNTVKTTIVSLLAVSFAVSCSNSSEEPSEQALVTPPAATQDTETSNDNADGVSVTTNLFGQRVVVPPADQSGGIARTKELKVVDDVCSESELKRVPEGLERQRVNAVELMFSSSDGPTTTRPGHVPDGYGQTVPGAVMTAANVGSLGLSGGPMSAEARLLFGGLTEEQKEKFERENPNWQEDYPKKKIDMSGAPTLPGAHKILSCYDDLMVVSMAYKEIGNGEGLYETPQWIKVDYPMRWNGKQWETDNNSSVVVQREVIGEELPMGWTVWEF